MSIKYYVNTQGLTALLVAQITALLLHVSRVPLWMMALMAAVIIWRVQILRSQWAFPNRLVRLLLVVMAIAAVVSYQRQWYALEPIVLLLLLAFVLKLLEVEERRDALVLLFVGFFVTASSFLFDQGIVMTLAGIMVLWLLVACLRVLHSETRLWCRRSIRTTTILLLQAVPLMLLLLFVFPRIGALWSVPLQSDSAVTGVSDSMSPGDFSQLTRSRELAFRVSFIDDRLPPPAERYWRGLVLTQFDGRRWQRQPGIDNTQLTLPLSQTPVSQYEIVLEATNTRWAYTMPTASLVGTPYNRTLTDELLFKDPATRRLRYQVNTYERVFREESQDVLNQALLLPRGFNPQTIAQARQWRQQSSSTEDYIQRVLAFYNQRFTYTLSPPPLGRNTIDDFLFATRRGFCEHFASSFVVLMRAVGIPARVVTGYQGGEWNEADRYLIIRQYDAHAWAEVWLPNRGWTRADPTAAVAPNRIEQGLLDSLSVNEQALVNRRPLPSFAWVNRLALKWDSLNYRWQRWVLSYDQDKQSEFLQRLLGEVTATRLALLLLIPGVITVLLLAWSTLRQRPIALSREVRLYRLLEKRLSRRGVKLEPGETLNDLCDKAITTLPDSQVLLQRIHNNLSHSLYQRKQPLSPREYQQLRRLLAQL